MHNRAYYMVNAITFYRMVAAPLLLLLVINDQLEVFRWLLAISFFTDAIDGFLARRYKVSSAFGAKLDSIADDLTIAAGIAGMLVFKTGFIEEHMFVIILLLVLFILQVGISFMRYGKMTSFHTYGAKLAAIFQGVFLILLFFLPQPVLFLFYITAAVTAIELAEEIIIALILPKWETDVKGLYWVMQRRRLG